MIMDRMALSASALVLALGMTTLPAHAQVDGDALFERLVAQFALQGISLEADEVQTDGDAVSITGLSISVAPGMDAFDLGDQRLEILGRLAHAALALLGSISRKFFRIA